MRCNHCYATHATWKAVQICCKEDRASHFWRCPSLCVRKASGCTLTASWLTWRGREWVSECACVYIYIYISLEGDVTTFIFFSALEILLLQRFNIYTSVHVNAWQMQDIRKFCERRLPAGPRERSCIVSLFSTECDTTRSFAVCTTNAKV